MPTIDPNNITKIYFCVQMTRQFPHYGHSSANV